MGKRCRSSCLTSVRGAAVRPEFAALRPRSDRLYGTVRGWAPVRPRGGKEAGKIKPPGYNPEEIHPGRNVLKTMRDMMQEDGFREVFGAVRIVGPQ